MSSHRRKKAQERLVARIAAYKANHETRDGGRGYRKPGSMSGRK